MDGYKEKIRKNITLYRERRGMSKADLARACHVSNPTVTNWESGRNSLDAEMIFIVSEILGISADTLAGRISPDVTYEEHKLLEKYRELDDADQAVVSDVLSGLHERSKKINAAASA